jgi:hypothetical protein
MKKKLWFTLKLELTALIFKRIAEENIFVLQQNMFRYWVEKSLRTYVFYIF